jgi:hypothetical protein
MFDAGSQDPVNRPVQRILVQLNTELMKSAGCADLLCDVNSAAEKGLSCLDGGIAGDEASADQVRSFIEERSGKPLGFGIWKGRRPRCPVDEGADRGFLISS